MALPRHLFCFGFGFSAAALAALLRGEHWRVTGTSRSAPGAAAIARRGFEAVVFPGDAPMENAAATLHGVTHVVVSVPPGESGDPVLRCHRGDLAACASLEWVGYLSTTGVYGNRDGGRVSETSPLDPSSPRARRRVEAETAWRAFGAETGTCVEIFRLAGIYGPGRSALDRVRDGTAQRIVKQGQIFSRVHVADIAAVLRAAIARPVPGAVYNVADDEPSPPQDVIAFAAALLGLAPPPEIPFEQADLSDMARSFYLDSKRVDNARIKSDLGVVLRYPDYRAGLRAILDGETRS